MQNQFDSYIKQLQELEQSDNRAALYSFCSLNEPILSYFKGIWNPLQAILCSSHIDIRIIDEIKPILTDLSKIKESYLSLKAHAKPEIRNEVLRFQDQIDTMTIYSFRGVASQLHALQQKNNAVIPKQENTPISDAEYWNNHKDAILRGQLSTPQDVALAETHVNEGRYRFFFKSLAAETKKAGVLDDIYFLSKRMFDGVDLKSILWSLVQSSISFHKKEDAILDLLYRIKDLDELKKLSRYCTTQKSLEAYKSKFKSLNSGCLSTVLFAIATIGLSIYGVISFVA